MDGKDQLTLRGNNEKIGFDDIGCIIDGTVAAGRRRYRSG